MPAGTPIDGGGGSMWTPNEITTTTEIPGSITGSACVQLDSPDLFGGETKEGGIVGEMCVMMGAADQVPLPQLVAMQAATGVPVPGYRGVATVWYNGRICANNPYPKVWKFRVRRLSQGWDQAVPWPTTVRIILAPFDVVPPNPQTYDLIHAMNGSHIVFESATNKAWGRGLDNVFIDEDSFARAAVTLYNECFGLCIKWNRQEDLGVFVQQILDHIGAATYISRQTGKLTIKLIRNDYTVSELPVFDYEHGLLSIEEDTSTSSSGLVNEVVVWYKDPLTNNKRSARVQNIAAMQSAGAVHSITKQYPGIPTKTLALRVAQRDLLAQGTPIKRYTVRLDRRAYYLHPASVIRVHDPLRGINEMVLRVGKIVDGEDDNGTFVLTCLQDVFGMPSTSFIGVEAGGYAAPVTTPVTPTDYVAMEAPYIDVYRALGATAAPLVDEASGYVESVMAAPSPMTTSFRLYTRTGAELYTAKATAAATTHGTLGAAVGGGVTVLSLPGFTDWARLNVNTIVLIDAEFMRLNAWDTVASTITVSRGVADTIPAVHYMGADVWFPWTGAAYDPTEYVDGEVVDTKSAPVTPTGTLDVSLAPVLSVTMASRAARPYPPADVKINTIPYDSFTPLEDEPMNDVVFTWATRNRITQGDTLIPSAAPSVAPEAGQTVVLEVDVGGIIVRTETLTTEDTFTYTSAMRVTDGVGLECTFFLSSERDGLRSFQQYEIPYFFPSGFGWRFGESFGE